MNLLMHENEYDIFYKQFKKTHPASIYHFQSLIPGLQDDMMSLEWVRDISQYE